MQKLKNSYFILLGFLIVLLACWPFLHSTFFRVHDYTHVARTVEMARALQAGHFPVQWSQNFGFGYGMPLFLFYGPLPFYLSSGLFLLGVPAVFAIKLVFLLTQVLAFSGMYTLMKRWGRTAGIVAGTAFLWAPYRALDIFVRGALNEVFALSLLPWILHFSFSVAEGKRKAWLGLSMTVAALLLTHNLTALMALPPLFVLSTASLLLQKPSWRQGVHLLGGYILGGLLSAFYVLPLLKEKDLTIVEEITSGYFDFRLHFLYIRQFLTARWGYEGSSWGIEDGISFHLGRVFLALAIVAVLFALRNLFLRLKKRSLFTWTFWQTQRKSVLILITAGLLGASLFLTLLRSQPIWELIPFLAYIQFPWRFLTLATTFLAMLVGWSISSLRNFLWRWTATLLVILALIGTQFFYHQPQKYLESNDQFYYTDEARIRSHMSDILFDYLPKGFERELPPIEPEDRIVVDASFSAEPHWDLNDPHQLLLRGDLPEGGTITWNIADFPGWRYYVNREPVEPELLPDGRRSFTSDEPITTIGALFTATPIRMIGNTISALTLIFWLAFAAPRFDPNQEKRESHVKN